MLLASSGERPAMLLSARQSPAQPSPQQRFTQAQMSIVPVPKVPVLVPLPTLVSPKLTLERSLILPKVLAEIQPCAWT